MEWYYVWWPWLASKRVAQVCQHQLSFLFKRTSEQFLHRTGWLVWLGARRSGWALEVGSLRDRLDSLPTRLFRAATLGKSFTCMCVCLQAVYFGSGWTAVTRCGWEGNLFIFILQGGCYAISFLGLYLAWLIEA